MEKGRKQNAINGYLDGGVYRFDVGGPEGSSGPATIPVSPTSSSSSLSPKSSGFIEHKVCNFDTLAGIAIKYGVEVADIKRLNGFTMDLQMFAYKSLRIPLPGRHPPSPYLSNGSPDDRERTPPCRPHDDILNSFQSLKPPRNSLSPAMSLLQGYYGLGPPKKDSILDGTEMALRKGKSICLEDESWLTEPPNSEPLFIGHRKTKSLVNGFSLENGERTEERTTITDSSDNEKSIRRRQKADASPELKPRAGKGLALPPKSSNRPDMNKSQQNLISLGDSSFSDVLQTVRKSSSTPDFQESDSNTFSIWPTGKWSLKPDSFAIPLFDGLPNPISSWKNKAARD